MYAPMEPQLRPSDLHVGAGDWSGSRYLGDHAGLEEFLLRYIPDAQLCLLPSQCCGRGGTQEKISSELRVLVRWVIVFYTVN